MAVLLILSYRDEELDRTDPLRVVLGDLSEPGRVVARVTLDGLSETAIATLADREDIDAPEMHARTGGNPFFVTEVLAAGTDQVPQLGPGRSAGPGRTAHRSGPRPARRGGRCTWSR